MTRLRTAVLAAATLVAACGVARADRDADLAAINAAVIARSDAMIATHVSRPFPALAPDPGSPALGNASYALAALWTNTDVAHANQLLMEVRDGAFADEYWAMGEIVRAYELFSCDSAFRPGRLAPDAEEAIEDVIRRHLDLYSRHADAIDPNAWVIDGSENHDVMRRSVNLLGSAILARDPARAAVPLPDGLTLAEHRDAWSAFFVRYLRERGSRGLFVERGSPTYCKYTLQSIFNLRDFADSAEVRDLAGKVLDLYFADASHEVIEGVRGGAKSRSYHDASSALGTSDSLRAYLHLLAGTPATLPLTQHPSSLCPATSEYRIPREVLDLLAFPDDRGAHAFTACPPGRGTRVTIPPPVSTFYYYADFPADVLATSLVTSGYIAGAACVDRSATYMEIESQNRWCGAIFRGSANSRVYAQCVALQSGNRVAYDETSGIAEGDAMIVQRLPASTGGPLRVYFSSDLVRQEAGGWVFARDPAGTAYVGVRPSRGAYSWDAPEAAFPGGTWMRPDDGDAPVIFQLGLSTDFGGDFAAFQARAQANAMQWVTPSELRYAPTRGREIAWFTNRTLPKLGGVTVDLAPPKAFASPFLDWDAGSLSGTVTSTPGYGRRTRTIDLTSAATPEHVVIEAESGALAAPMIVADDVAASGRSFVHVPEGVGTSGEVRFAFTAPVAGAWTLWARVQWLDAGANSLFESVDGEAPLVLGDGAPAPSWQWVRGATRALAAGAHELVIANRDDGARLDQIVLTTDASDAPPNTVERGVSDADADGVPDAWMQARFGHAMGGAPDASRAGDDADGDGDTTLQEYLAGTDPLDVRDSLLVFVAKPAGPAIRFATRAATGPQCPAPSRHYAVLSSGVASGGWAVVAGLGDLLAGAPVDAALPAGGALEFYVVEAGIR